MSSEQPSQYPPSMGPGARPVPQGDGSGPVSQRDRNRNSRLQEVISIRNEYSVDPSPSSITIAYTLNNRQRSFNLEYSALPLSSFSAQVLFGGRARAKTTGIFIIDAIRGVENVTSTHLTQQQAEGVAKHACKRMLWSYAGIGSALGLAAFMWQRGRHNMKFPFIKPRDPSRYENFPNRYIPILKGQYARIMWQITRFNVYLTLGIFGLSPIFGSIGDTSMTVGLYRDDRTRSVLEKVKGTAEGLKRIGGNLPAAAGTSPNEFGSEDYNAEAAFSNGSDGGGGDSDVAFDDGMNNTGDVPASTRPSPSQMRGQVPQQQQKERQQQQQRPPRWGQRPQQGDATYTASAPDTAADPFDFNEDPLSSATADPNSPQYNPSSSAAVTHQQKPRQQRSWASIRNEARQGQGEGHGAMPPHESASPYSQDNSGGRRGQQGHGAGAGAEGESFSYGAEEAEKQYAKEQAQREFDALLERERHLGETGVQGGGGGGGGERAPWGRRGRGGG